MELVRIKENIFYIDHAVNMGYIQNGGKGLLIDSGIDKGTGKKVWKLLKEADLPVTDLLITHAHADHFGGASWLKENGNVTVHATQFEGAVLENPRLEPIYLFQGAEPLSELRNKFLEGPPVKVDHYVKEGPSVLAGIKGTLYALPGHSYDQIAFYIEGILFAADSYFAKAYLEKHTIPFMVDIEKAQASLQFLLSLEAEGAVPGHGMYETNYKDTVKQNIDWHTFLLNELEQELHEQNDMPVESLTSHFLRKKNIPVPNIGAWVLFRTAVLAYLKALKEQGKAEFRMKDYQFIIQPIQT
ncbi:MBL fold metallo-hydrolase [Alteribacillus bidgolensis]|uniref:beta-lactamase n=1 Tax=Alteribacillus bidgolensis TaxID=930129 RepID=A0A1G8J7X5_9BACI|nr:MBL fold metallo-hydrolase [Alteribacillus bidgolensis]SDI27368.1 Glyoxylase, beta-lactamase superfamily II [Alteribacillus bidgolensis]